MTLLSVQAEDMSNAIELEKYPEGLVIRFTRPELRNPLSVSVIDEIDSILKAYENEPEVKTVIFTGSEDVFASGADLREIAALDRANAAEFGRRGQRLMEQIASLRQQTIAAVNGACFGGALDLTLAFDKRIASPNATFCHPGVGLGIITGWGGTQRLPRLIGEANALEMFFTARPIDAEEALRIGLIDMIEADPLNAARP